MMNDIGKKIEHLMNIYSISFGELSDRTNIPKSALHRYVTGETEKIPINRVVEIAKFFNVTPEYLLDWNNLNHDYVKDFHEKGYRYDIKMQSEGYSLDEVALLTMQNKDENISDIYLDTQKTGIRIPVLGKVIAGIPIEAVEEILDYEEIDEKMARTGEFFALQIKGDSMEPIMSEKDVVIVRKQEDVDSGDTAIILVNGDEATVKKVIKKENGIMLVPTNPAYEPMFFDEYDIQMKPVKIIGRVMELRKKY